MQKKAEKAKRVADLVARKAIWEFQRRNMRERSWNSLAKVLKAGPPPLLRNQVVLGEKPSESAVPSSSAEITQNSRKGKGRLPRISIDSLIGKAIDYNGTETGEESGFWSANNENDE